MFITLYVIIFLSILEVIVAESHMRENIGSAGKVHNLWAKTCGKEQVTLEGSLAGNV